MLTQTKTTIKRGWVKSIRQSKGLIFLAVTTGESDFQITILQEKCKIQGEIKVGCSFETTGEDSKTPKGLYEFLATEFKVIGTSDDSYPIQPKAHSSDFLRTIPEHRGRTKQFQAIWKLRHHLTQSIHRFFDEEGIYLYTAPMITKNDCEGAGETFKVTSDWLDANLTVSSQLEAEIGARSLGKVYTFGPSFRAEKSATKKHLSEFWHTEVEISFIGLEEMIKFAEKFVKAVISNVVFDRGSYELTQLGIDPQSFYDLVTKSWEVKTYDQICEEFGVKWGDDINSETEQKIVSHYGVPTFITHYPKVLKPFYMAGDDRVAYNFDLIFPEVGETIGGSTRESSYDVLKKSMIDTGIDVEKMQWYLDLRKYGSCVTSGYGLGFDRLLMFITKAQKIHDVIPFPVSF
jgi:asparaginyl-tRNA synthetase